MSNVESASIRWPEEASIQKRVLRNSTASTIQSLFANTGIVVSIIYITIKQIIVPSLNEKYLQRIDFSASILLYLRRILAELQGRLKVTPVSSLGFNEVDGRIERSTQTSDDDHQLANECPSRWERFNNKLKEAENQLQFFNLSANSTKNMDSFHLQVKLLVDSIKMNDSAEKTEECCNRIIRSVREAKGWFVNGRSP